MTLFPCPYLQGNVEFSKERELHIQEGHPDLLPDRRSHIAATLADPGQVRRSARSSNARMFSRWYSDLSKYVVVVVISESSGRHWIISSYIARRLTGGEPEWDRN